jgi:hypothetical protein
MLKEVASAVLLRKIFYFSKTKNKKNKRAKKSTSNKTDAFKYD